MKFEILIIAGTLFLVANTYHDGKYIRLLKSWKKYYQMAGIVFFGLSSYAYIKKYPGKKQPQTGFVCYKAQLALFDICQLIKNLVIF